MKDQLAVLHLDLAEEDVKKLGLEFLGGSLVTAAHILHQLQHRQRVVDEIHLVGLETGERGLGLRLPIAEGLDLRGDLFVSENLGEGFSSRAFLIAVLTVRTSVSSRAFSARTSLLLSSFADWREERSREYTSGGNTNRLITASNLSSSTFAEIIFSRQFVRPVFGFMIRR